jgi:hypothetical protein
VLAVSATRRQRPAQVLCKAPHAARMLSPVMFEIVTEQRHVEYLTDLSIMVFKNLIS